MAVIKLIVIHHPTHFEFFVDEKKIVINRKTYFKHFFTYEEVVLTTFFEDFYDLSYKIPLLLKLFSTKKTIIKNVRGKELSVTAPVLLTFLYSSAKRLIFGEINPVLKLMKRFRDWLRVTLVAKFRILYFTTTYRLFQKKNMISPLQDYHASDTTPIEDYWGDHTVHSLPFITASESRKTFEKRIAEYVLFKEYMQLYESRKDQIIMDYGCGPGNDLTLFALYSKAKKIYGVDVSPKALRLAQHRLALHRINPGLIEFLRISDQSATIPVEDNSIDYLYSHGVVHHTSYPERILREFYRVLKPKSKACVMVYNYDSIWMHIHAAYLLQIQMGLYPGLTAVEVFSKCMDGEDCPKVLCYRSEEFIPLCRSAGFEEVEYLGGFFNTIELEYVDKYRDSAIHDERLGEEHRAFLKNLEFDERGFPTYNGKTVGFGGVYNLFKH